MDTRELIHQEVDSIKAEYLDELFEIIRRFSQSKRSRKPGLMSKLKSIAIEAPEDFAAHHDLYVAGAQSAEPNLR